MVNTNNGIELPVAEATRQAREPNWAHNKAKTIVINCEDCPIRKNSFHRKSDNSSTSIK